MQVVKVESPVADSKPFLRNWDLNVRQNFVNHESMRVAAAENLRILSRNWLTSWRTVPQLRHRYTAVDTIALQQQLGHIYDSEVAEVNRVLGGSKRFFKSNSSELYTVDSLSSTLLLGGGLAFAFVGIVTLRSNFLWAAAGVVPCLLHTNFS